MYRGGYFGGYFYAIQRPLSGVADSLRYWPMSESSDIPPGEGISVVL